MSLRPAVAGLTHHRRHPFYRRYGASLPNSLGRGYPSRLSLLGQGTVFSSRYGRPGSIPAPFSRAPGLGRSRKPGPIVVWPPSRHYGSPGAYPTWQGCTPCRPSPRRRRQGLRCRAYPDGRGILTPFPFAGEVLPPGLGPTHPWLTFSAKEPWPFRRRGISPLFGCY